MDSGSMTLIAALLAGLVGSSHCLVMCGPIAMAFGMDRRKRPLVSALLYNGGRICSYAIAGAIIGGLGLWLGEAIHGGYSVTILRTLVGLVMVAVGLQLAFGWRLLRPIESAGMHLWQRLSPYAGRLLQRRGPLAAFGLGALWGWLPCGLVYTMLTAAAFSGGSLEGAGLMAAFGIGTAPALIVTGTAASRFRHLTTDPRWRCIGGVLIICLGIATAAAPALMAAMHGGDHAAQGDHAGHMG